MDPPDAPDRIGGRRDASDLHDDEPAAVSVGGGELEMEPLVSSSPSPSSGGGGRGSEPPADPDASPMPSRPQRGRYSHTASREPPSSGRMLLPPARHGRPGANDANVAHAKNAGGDGAGERVASALSNEGILNALQRLHLAAHSVSAAAGNYLTGAGGGDSNASTNDLGARAAANNAGGRSGGGGSGLNPAQAAAGGQQEEEYVGETSSDKRKKMFLLLMITLFIAMMGAAVDKKQAVGFELEVEEGEVEKAFHEEEGLHSSNKEGSLTIHKIDVEGYQPKTMVNATDYFVPGTEGAPPFSGAAGRPYYPILNHFQHRNPTSHYAKKWGYFDFDDPDPKWRGKMRPQPDFTKAPNRDVKNSDFPDGAWQKDQAYMEEFLKECKKLVNRSMEAIYGEYGVGIPEDGSVTLTDEVMVNRDLFEPWTVKETINSPGGGSWMTKKSLDDTSRRIIHHIMTGDTFKLVLGGHSAAAGHGAGFNQSYIIEAGHALEPVFAHMGVEFRAYNFAQGGMGTFQQSLAGMDLRGKETDWIMWDSRMTEKPEILVNFFLRQALISGNRAPVLMGDKAQLAGFHETAGASVAEYGNGWSPPTVSDEQVKEVPWAAQYLQCARGATTGCKGMGKEYTAGCWTPREDFTPPTGQVQYVGGQASWHPGNRIHKRRGRAIALLILRAIEWALNKWEEWAEEEGRFPISEEKWHVTDYYEGIREKTKDVGGCWGNNWAIGQKRRLEEVADDHNSRALLEEGEDGLGGHWPPRLCNLPLQGRSHWGPRNNPMESSLLSIMRPNPMGDVEPNIGGNAYMNKPCYDPPDRPAPWFVPEDEDEPYAPYIGASRRLDVEENHSPLRKGAVAASQREQKTIPAPGSEGNATIRILEDDDEIVPGYGIQVNWGRPGVCDGSSHGWCDKPCGSACLMGGAQDARGMVCIGGLSGWLVFDIKNVKHGFIGARLEPWEGLDKINSMNGWQSVNNGGKGNYDKRGRERRLWEQEQYQNQQDITEQMIQEIEDESMAEGDPDRERRLGGGQHCGHPGDYTFEFAVNGKRTSWNKEQFCAHFTRLNYNLDVIKFLDDETQTGDFELAMRLTDVGNNGIMCVTHMYWS